MYESNKIIVHSLIDLIANIIVKEALKLCTKPIKHDRSFPTPQANIQHGYCVEMFFENLYLVNLTLLLFLSEFWAWSTKLNPYFLHVLKILLI